MPHLQETYCTVDTMMVISGPEGIAATNSQQLNYVVTVSCNFSAEGLNLVAIISLCNYSVSLSDNGALSFYFADKS